MLVAKPVVPSLQEPSPGSSAALAPLPMFARAEFKCWVTGGLPMNKLSRDLEY